VSRRTDAIDAMIGVALMGAKVGEASARAGMATAQVAMRIPVVGAPLRTASERVTADGQRVRHEAIARIETTVDRIIESSLTVDMTDRVLRSPAMQHAIEHLASSPDLRQAITEQTTGMAEQTMEGVRRRSEALDDVTERTVRRWLHRPRPHEI
jgi:hypothetical protein